VKDSKIEWCDHTFNPWIGCTKISPGCENCYAEARDKRFTDGSHWGPRAPRRRTSAANWMQPIKWNRDAVGISHAICPKCGWQGQYQDVCPTPDCLTFGSEMEKRPPRVFCASLSDWLDDKVPIEWFADLLSLIYFTPNLDWLLLTKRPENFMSRIFEAWNDASMSAPVYSMSKDWDRGTAPQNVWIGTTVEDQERADQRIPELLKIPARIRFLSCEPLLGPIEFGSTDFFDCMGHPMIQWVICGGESGQKARPNMHPEWPRSLRDQCKDAGVPFLFKQWGEWKPCAGFGPTAPGIAKGRLIRFSDGYCLERVGKQAAGRLLTGIEHNQFPTGIRQETHAQNAPSNKASSNTK